MVPPLLIFHAKHPLVDKHDLSSLNIICCDTAPLSKDIQLDVSKRLRNHNELLKNFQGYGMTESTVVATIQNPETCLHVDDSIGQLLCGTSGKVGIRAVQYLCVF